ncbi:MAG: hypothetical protein HKN57_06495 [Xanthomonadales bacterium]|nr:hypothetical protein [Xanthomonadales bacterium]NNK97600.1 hypothetical protein [Xanthomonadales bacterium]
MKRIRLRSHVLALVALLMLLCTSASSVNAQNNQEGLTWPVETRLMVKDWNPGTPDAWIPIGEVDFVNGHKENGNLQITIDPIEPYTIGEVRIHIVQDLDDFDSILDKKTGQPKASKFDYKTDYFGDQGITVESHVETIPLSNFDVCWGPNLTACPPLYTIVSVILYEEQVVEDVTTLVRVPEDAYAENEGVFSRFDKDDDRIWGMYVTYVPAKVEPGHFIDAIVNGLSYVTVTQTNFGITGEGGQFWYLPGEYIAFYAGNLYLGDALGDHQVSPPDLFGQADMDDDRVLNVARLLQSLDADGNPAQGAINLTAEVVDCLNSALGDPPPVLEPELFFSDDAAVGALIDATIAVCRGTVSLAAVTKAEALENLNNGMQAGNLMKRNISKSPDLKSNKAKIDMMPVYVPARRSDDTLTEVVYFDENDAIIETRYEAKPIVVSYLDEVEGTGALDVWVAISRDDGDSWKRSNISKTAKKSSLVGYAGESWKPMLKVKDNKIFVAWTDKYCRGGRPGYGITVCDAFDVDSDDDGEFDTCEVCRETDEGTMCRNDYTGDDTYWQDDIFGVAGPQRSVIYEDYPDMGEVPYSCVWAARGIVATEADFNAGIGDYVGDIVWFKPEKLTSGRRDAFQLFAGAGTDVAFAIVWQEDPKGLLPGDGEGPGDGWSGANTNNKADIWYSYITLKDFAKIDYDYPSGEMGENDEDLAADPELTGRVKALVPMTLPVRISDNEVCSAENMDPDGGNGEHDFDGEGKGTHRYCGTIEGIGTAAVPGFNPLCAYTLEKANPKGEIHNVCVTADGRFLDGNTGASRPNIFLQPYKKPDGSKSAWVIIGYEESKGVGSPPEGEHDDDGCGGSDDYIPVWPVEESDEHDEDRYKPDMGKNVFYHSFDLFNPVTVASGGMINQPEIKLDDFGNPILDGSGNPIPVYLTEDPALYAPDPPPLLLDWKDEPIPATNNARRVRFVTQPKSKKGASGTVLVALYREGEEGRGKPADIFMRRMKASPSGNPYAFGNFTPGAMNLSSVSVSEDPNSTFQDPFDPEKPIKMLRWTWVEDNLNDSSARNPFSDARAHRGALNGDDLLIGYTWTPNWGRKANDKYDFYIRRSFNGGQHWTTDKTDTDIEHNVVFRVPVIDDENQEVTWDEEVVTTVYEPGAIEPPRNVSNLRNYRTTVEEPRLVKTPGTIKNPDGTATGYPEDKWDSSVYQLAYGLDFNQNTLPDGVEQPKLPLDIYYSRTLDKGQRYQSVIVTPQGGNGKPEEGWNPLAKDKPQQGAAQLRQTPDGSRMYGIWLEEGDNGSDIMFRRVDYRD